MINGFFKVLFVALISILLSLISFVIFDAPNMKNIMVKSGAVEGIDFTLNSGKKIANMIENIIRRELIDDEKFEKNIEDSVKDEIFQDIGISEFFVEDKKNWSFIKDMSTKIYKEKLDTKTLDKFSDLEIKAENILVSIKRGNEYTYTIYGKEKIKNPYKNLKIEKNKNKLNLYGDNNSMKYKIEFTIPDMENLNMNFIGENGVLRIDDSIKSLKAHIENGVFVIKGKKSYPINMYSESMIANIKFDNYDANIELGMENGVLNFFDKSHLNIDGGNKFKKILGDGKDNINILSENGVINIK